MLQFFVISESNALIGSLTRHLRNTPGADVKPVHLPSNSSVDVFRSFRQVADAIEGSVESDSFRKLRETVALFHFHDPSLRELEDLDPLGLGWAAVAAMLVLAFPEVHWLFLTSCPTSLETIKEFHTFDVFNVSADLTKVLDLHAQRFTPLFDATNLRNAIRKGMRGRRVGGSSSIPVRDKVAVAIDDEEAYAFLHGYTAYRFGFRSHVISSYGMMKRVLQNDAPCGGVSLSFEDLYLNFPDQDSSVHLSSLEDQRDYRFAKLAKVDFRIFVTIGHKRSVNETTWRRNEEYLNRLRGQSKWNKTLYKPVSGIFDLWKRAGLQRKLGQGQFQGLANGFVWPPDRLVLNDDSHSASGCMLEIADRLIRRAESILKSADTVPDAVHGSLLALEAREMLGNRTPTTSLAALAIKHQLEALAECLFYGVQYNKDVKGRFQDIEREVQSIGDWFRRPTRRLSELNAEISIMSELMIKFRDHNQFDEEQQCLARLRWLHRYLWFAKHKWYAWLFYPGRWYVELLLGSMIGFIGAIVGWILILGLSYWLICPDGRASSTPMLHGYADAFTAFFGLQPPHEMSEKVSNPTSLTLLTMLATVLGFVHLGVFVSHLYSVIARR